MIESEKAMNLTKPLWLMAIIVSLMLFSNEVSAHEWHRHGEHHHHHGHDDSSSKEIQVKIKIPNTEPYYILTNAVQQRSAGSKPDIAAHFEHFKNVKVRWDASTLFVESNGLPDHNMMVGIRSWQQQVPLPQPFTGNNAWQVPLQPKLADRPISAKTNLYRGAIALAVNGVPIFNALNNRGEDAYLAGELDRWGGHCGRGDDYHYHMAPVHLQEVVGKGNPIAFALDGFPIYGLTEADGSSVGKLDELNGQFDKDGNYHYHATKTYPYINGGLRGVVLVRGDQVEPQPRDSPVRPPFEPLRGAVIKSFKTNGIQSTLTYQINTRTGTVSYVPNGANAFRFTYREPGGRTWSQTYNRRPRPDQGNRPALRRPRR